MKNSAEPLRYFKTASLAALLCLSLPASIAYAANCGDDDCGDFGTCNQSSLLSKCDCDDGYVSVTTYLETGSLGAYCVPIAASEDSEACQDFDCGPHGVCLEALADGGMGGRCLCDPGYMATAEGTCEDDPDDAAELACERARCGTDGVCMVVSDALTCRCLTGGDVVLGRAADDGFGPVCSSPPDPTMACGPDACGPYGECRISQAVFCDCDSGAEQRQLQGPDGKMHPYCVDPDKPWPVSGDAGVVPMPGPDAGANPGDADAGSKDKPKDTDEERGCCTVAAGDARSSHGAPLAFAALGLLAWTRRRRHHAW